MTMYEELIERLLALREYYMETQDDGNFGFSDDDNAGLLKEAADAIEKLEAENEELFTLIGQQGKELNRRAENNDVVHARWIHPVPGDGDHHCSNCKVEAPYFGTYGHYEPRYCPHCGAKMDG